MTSSPWTPDVVIGIDFGMTCSGVAYSSGPDWPAAKCIQQWPGQMGDELANKAATRLQHNASGNLKAWGQQCDDDDLGCPISELFKLYLDPRYIDTHPSRPSVTEARQHYKEYMTCLFRHIEDWFSRSYPRWETKKVEYLFSIPTTWKNPSVSAAIESLIKAAGFGGKRELRRVKISQTEAEAAAVYAAKQHYRLGDVVLVCDAGGGTTDVNILKIVADGWGITGLKPLTWAEGQPIGSTLMDKEMELHLAQKLAGIPRRLLSASPETTARRMLKGKFERFKCAFGSDPANVPTLALRVPGLTNETFADLDITEGSLIVTTTKLQAVFDKQLHRMLNLINEQIGNLQTRNPAERITFIVLSGGLGSSPYIRKKLKAHYEMMGGSLALSRNAQDLKVLLAPEPQLAVAQGLVMDRVQALSRGVVIYQDRCSRVSYGVLCLQPYDAIKHRGEEVMEDSLDKKRWAVGQIDWLIKQGDTVPQEGIQRPYNLKIPLGQESELWRATFVTSAASPEQLPQSMRHDGVEIVCVVKAKFSTRGMEIRNKQLWVLRPQYNQVEFNVKVMVGSADIKFQLLDLDGNALSKRHAEVEVTWDPAE